MSEESVIYQDIFRKGEQRGLQQGERKVVMHLLERRFGRLSLQLRRQIEQFAAEPLEALGEAWLDFRTKEDLTRRLNQHAPARRRRA
jgi:predicted transposase YdaD